MIKSEKVNEPSKHSGLGLAEFVKKMPEIHKADRIALSLVLLLCSSVSSTLVLRMMGQLIDSKDHPEMVNKQICIFLAAVAFNFVALLVREFSARLLSEKILREMRVRVFRHFMQADMEFFDRHGAGDLLGKLSSDVATAESCSTENILDGISNSIMYLSNLVMLLQISIRMTLVVILSLPLFVYITAAFTSKNKQLAKRCSKIVSKSHNFMEERFSNVLTVAAFRRQEIEIANMERFTEEALRLTKERVLYNAMYKCINRFIPWVCATVALLVGIYLSDRPISEGQLTSYLLLSQEISSNSKGISKSVATLTATLGSLTKLFQLLNYVPKIVLNKGSSLEPHLSEFDIELRNVSFHYSKSPTLILKDVNLYIRSGEFIGIIGSSGSGKSSLLKTLLRMYDPTGGQLLLNKTDIKQYSISSYHGIIGYVTQDPLLFSGSIRSNILYGKPDATEEELAWAIQMAGMSFINDLRKGLETSVGQRGTKLSGGQKQRLSIARALIRRPKILIFDEATSALDSQNEKLIQRSIEHIVEETKKRDLTMTVIVVAHRLSTVRAADKIIVMEKGTIASCGNHEYLLQTSEPYQRLTVLDRDQVVKPKEEDSTMGDTLSCQEDELKPSSLIEELID